MVKLHLLSLFLALGTEYSHAQKFQMTWDKQTTCGKVDYKNDLLKRWPHPEDPGGLAPSVPRNIGKCAKECRLRGKQACKGFVFYYKRKACLLFKVDKDPTKRVESISAACGKWIPISEAPTPVPTSKPTEVPTLSPTAVPTKKPTPVPTKKPTPVPTKKPTKAPQPTTEKPIPSAPAPRFKKYGTNQKCAMSVNLRFGNSPSEMNSYGYHNDYLVIQKVRKQKDNRFCCLKLGDPVHETWWGCRHDGGDASVYNYFGQTYYDEVREENASVANITQSQFIIDSRHWFNSYEADFPAHQGFKDHIFPAQMKISINDAEVMTVSHVVNEDVDTHIYQDMTAFESEYRKNPKYKSNVRVKVKCKNKCRCILRVFYNIKRTNDVCDFDEEGN